MNILEWLGGHDTGESSKTLALTALGQMPKHPAWPHDGQDFGRCYRLQREAVLIELNPEYASLARKRITADAPLLAAS